jgi:tetratricopeptide (TPR) repeat protein
VTVRRTRFFGTARAAIQSAQRFTTVPLAAVAVATLVVAGCSQEKKAISEIRAAYEASEYREAVALCRHAIRRGVDPAEVYYYYGVSLVSMDRDFEGFRQLEIAAEHDPTSARKIAQFLFENGEQTFQKRLRTKSARRIQKAVEIDPVLDLGRYAYLVADEYFATKDYENARRYYARAIEAHPDTSAAEGAYLNLAISCAETGAASRAREYLETLLDRYPRSALGTDARWRLVNLLYEEGEKQFVLGNYLETVEVIEELLTRTRNPGLKQKSRFLLGETYEALGEFDNAYQQYRKIIEGDRGASGRIVERAREKIAALREAGLY